MSLLPPARGGEIKFELALQLIEALNDIEPMAFSEPAALPSAISSKQQLDAFKQ